MLVHEHEIYFCQARQLTIVMCVILAIQLSSKSKIKLTDNLRLFPGLVLDIDSDPRAEKFVLKWPVDTWQYSGRLPLFSFPDNVLDTKVTTPYFVQAGTIPR